MTTKNVTKQITFYPHQPQVFFLNSKQLNCVTDKNWLTKFSELCIISYLLISNTCGAKLIAIISDAIFFGTSTCIFHNNTPPAIIWRYWRLIFYENKRNLHSCNTYYLKASLALNANCYHVHVYTVNLTATCIIKRDRQFSA